MPEKKEKKKPIAAAKSKAPVADKKVLPTAAASKVSAVSKKAVVPNKSVVAAKAQVVNDKKTTSVGKENKAKIINKTVAEVIPARKVEKIVVHSSKPIKKTEAAIKPVGKKSVKLVKKTKGKTKYEPLTEKNGIVVEQYRSSIRQPAIQRKQLKTLGLGRIGKTKTLPKIRTIAALLERLRHLVREKEK
jgi:ribosomal protein L30/L7E